MINFGLVGVGGFAATWRRVLAQLEAGGHARIAAVAERDLDGQTSTLSSLMASGCRVYPSLTDMIRQEGDILQIVGLPVGIPWHASLAIEALEAGYDVLIEKPLAATVQQATDIQTAAQHTGRHCQVAYQFMYSPTIQQLRAKIQSGTLGHVLSMSSITGWPRAASYYRRNGWAGTIRSGGQWVLDGPATNATAHYLMNMLYLGACSPGTDDLASIVSAQGELYHAKPIESYDTSSIRVCLSNGAQVVHNVSHAISETIDPVIDMRFDQAAIHWDAKSDTATITYADKSQEVISNPAPDQIHSLPLRHMVATVGGQSSLPASPVHCTIDLAARQVLAINLAFESSGAIRPIPQSVCHTDAVGAGDSLVAVDDMASILQAAHAKACLISELGVPWSIATKTVSSDGYRIFPQHFGMS